MASQIQYRRGTNAQNAAFTGALAEITVDTTNGTLRVHDGITVGGSNIATVAYVNSQVSSASSIANGTSSVAVIASGGNIRANVGGSTITNTYSSGLAVTGLISATGTVTAASVVGGVITGSSVSVTGTVNGTTLTGTSLTVSTGNITGGNLILSGAIQDSGQLDIQTTASNGNIVLSPNGTGNINTGANIMPTANATANIGSAALSYNTIFAKATSAQYADLAEMYCADLEYTPGTVLEFGGNEEVTATTQSHSTRVAGIVSTNPSYLMNSTLKCVNAVQVALVGRVPCHVIGTIAKGDRLVASSTSGVAIRLDMTQYQPGCIIGKALEAYNSETVGTIEVAVGRN
jgi:trimeric autotransporter adhesin